MPVNNYAYGRSSKSKIENTHNLMEFICYRAIEIANETEGCPDFGISWGLRTIDEQFALYKKGRDLLGDNSGARWAIVDKSKVVTYKDGMDRKSYHQTGCAIDFFAYVDGKYNDEKDNLAIIASCFKKAAEEAGIEYEWGGDWNFYDPFHFEIHL